jgi:hypothetical protein
LIKEVVNMQDIVEEAMRPINRILNWAVGFACLIFLAYRFVWLHPAIEDSILNIGLVTIGIEILLLGTLASHRNWFIHALGVVLMLVVAVAGSAWAFFVFLSNLPPPPGY